MSTLVQIRDEIVIRADVKSDPNYPKPWLNRMINDAQLYVQGRLAHLGIHKWLKTDSLTLSSGTYADKNDKTADLTTDCPSMLESPDAIKRIATSIGIGTSTDKGIAKAVDIDVYLEHIRNTFLTPTLSEPIFTRDGAILRISPSTVDTAVATYYKQVATLSSDATESEIPEHFVLFVINKVVMDIKLMKGMLNDKQEAMRQLNEDIAKAYESFKIAESEESKFEQSMVLQ